MRTRTIRRFSRRNIQRRSNNAQPFFQPLSGELDNTIGAPSFFSPAPTGAVQPKLTVNEPGDRHEQEADAMANAVVQRAAMKEEEKVQKAPQKEEEKIQKADKKEEEKVQRTAKPEEEEMQRAAMKEEELQKAPQEEEEKIQKSSTGNTLASPNVSARIQQSRGQGNTLPAATQQEMSSAFGYDFSKVRIHTNSEAANLSDELSAHAFTLGKDVYFNRGKFNPGTQDGKRLLAHELTHVVQQGGGIHKKEAHSEPLNEAQSIEIIGAEKEENTTHYGNCQGVTVQGRTDANYTHSYSSTGSQSAGRDCDSCGGTDCISSVGTVTSVLRANPTVSLPAVPSGLNECEAASVRNFINTTLRAHEQQHVAAFNTYNARIRTPYSYNGCRAGLDAYIESIHNGIEASRRSASDAASARLDPFNVPIPCNCPDADADPATEQSELNIA